MRKLHYIKLLLIFFCGLYPCFVSAYTASSPITLSGQSNIIISGKSFTAGVNGAAIYLTNCTNVEIINCGFYLTKDIIGVQLMNCSNVKISGGYFENFRSGVYAVNCTGGIDVSCNSFKNIAGAKPRGQMVQFNTCSGTGNRVNYNILDHTFGTGSPEDLINMYASAGTSADPIQIIGNKLRGGGPSTSGGGIMLGDNGGHDLRVEDNILVDVGQYGIGCPAGYNITIKNNQIYGARQAWTNVGLYVGLASEIAAGFPCEGSSISVINNKVKWFRKDGVLNGWYNCPCCTGLVQSGNNFNAAIDASILPAALVLNGGACSIPVPTKTNTPASTKTFTPAATRTFTPISTKTFTAAATKTFTQVVTKTHTPAATKTFTRTQTKTFTTVVTATYTPTPTNTLTSTAANTSTLTATKTATPVPSATFTSSRTKTATASATYTLTVEITASQTATATAAQTLTSVSTACFTATPSVTAVCSPVISVSPSNTITALITGTHTVTETPTAQNSPSFTPTFSFTSTATSTSTRTVLPLNTPTFTITPPPSSTVTAVPAASATATSTVTVVLNEGLAFVGTRPVYCYPNPSVKSSGITIGFRISGTAEKTELKLYTVSGRLIRKITLNEKYGPGTNSFQVGPAVTSGLAAGTYYYCLILSNRNQSIEKKCVLLLLK